MEAQAALNAKPRHLYLTAPRPTNSIARTATASLVSRRLIVSTLRAAEHPPPLLRPLATLLSKRANTSTPNHQDCHFESFQHHQRVKSPAAPRVARKSPRQTRRDRLLPPRHHPRSKLSRRGRAPALHRQRHNPHAAPCSSLNMAANANRFSSYTSTSAGTGPEGKDGEQKKDMWSSMLDSVASGKRLPEKNLLVLGMQR